jgi:hypothetical protein
MPIFMPLRLRDLRSRPAAHSDRRPMYTAPLASAPPDA